VHEAGVYTVAGINEVGIGAFSGGKTVTISECVPFIDLLVGLWDATGAVWFDNKTMYNNHSFTIEKINDTTIKINNFDGSEVEGINNVITATVDNVARTIFIPFQHSLTQFSWQGDEIWYSRAAHPHPCQNAGDIGTLEVDGIGQNLSVTFPHKYVGGELGGVLCNVTYHMLFYTGETCRGVAAWGANTVWTKRK
jgi:hypothetical protein